MKINSNKILLISCFALTLLILSCTKKTESILGTNTNFTSSSLVRVYVATVNANRNYIYVDGQPINGAALVSGGMFPAAGVYAAEIPIGVKGFLVRDTLAATTQVPLTFAENLSVGNYTIFLYDTITSPKQKTVLTNFVVPTDTSCRIRFANFIYNPFDIPAIDVFSYNKNANLFTNIAVTDVTSFVPYPSRLGIDTLYIRETGTTTNIIKLSMSGLSEKRNYTLVYRGSHRGTRIASLFTDR
jgi:hypothetical protein